MPLLARLEEGVFRLCGIREEMGWRQYTLAVLVFSVIGAVAVYALQRLQPWLPLNRRDCRTSRRIRASTRRSAS